MYTQVYTRSCGTGGGLFQPCPQAEAEGPAKVQAWGWDGNPAIAAVGAAPRAVRIHRPPPNTWASDVYRCTEKEDSFRSRSNQFCPERNTKQTLMQSLLSPFLTCPYAEQHGKSLLTEFTAEKTI